MRTLVLPPFVKEGLSYLGLRGRITEYPFVDYVIAHPASALENLHSGPLLDPPLPIHDIDTQATLSLTETHEYSGIWYLFRSS